MKEPETDLEFEAALEKLGYEMVCDEGYSVRRVSTGAKTRLDAEDYTSALVEAWNFARP